MSLALPLSEEHRDCLQEVCNIAMGAAGESLADFAKVFVNLSIPKIRYIKPEAITEALESLRGDDLISCASQFFTMDDHGGYALVVITEPSFQELAQCTGHPLANDADTQALLRELTLTINQTCLPRLAELMCAQLESYAPDVLSLHQPLNEFCVADIAGWDHVVSIEINYHLENLPFNCDLLLLLPDVVVDELEAALAALLAD